MAVAGENSKDNSDFLLHHFAIVAVSHRRRRKCARGRRGRNGVNLHDRESAHAKLRGLGDRRNQHFPSCVHAGIAKVNTVTLIL